MIAWRHRLPYPDGSQTGQIMGNDDIGFAVLLALSGLYIAVELLMARFRTSPWGTRLRLWYRHKRRSR